MPYAIFIIILLLSTNLVLHNSLIERLFYFWQGSIAQHEHNLRQHEHSLW